MVMLFSSVGQNKRGRLVTCSDGNIRWKFLFRSYIPRCRLESVIAKYSKHPHRCGDWQLHIHLKALDSSVLEPCRSTTHASKIIPQAAAMTFQTEMATKRQNLQTAALKRCHGSINSSDNGEKHYTQPYIHLHSHRPAKLRISPCK